MIYEPGVLAINVPKIGGKARNLLHLHNKGFNVPRWFVLSSDVFFEFLGSNKEMYQNLLEHYNGNSIDAITKLIQETEFSESLKKEIRFHLSMLNPSNKLAVRSSATDEDGLNHSFAGMMESFLYVEASDDIFDYIKKCYISCFSERAMKYRSDNGLISPSIAVAVIVQEMVDPDYAGVMFTTNPQTNNPDETLISVVKGVGESLVSGSENSSDYVVDCVGNVTHKALTNGVGISDKVVTELFDIGQSIEKSYKQRYAQDIEFCIKDNKVYVLQTRVITNYSHIDKSQFKTILDNSNIIESYSGVTTPLTYTFAKEVYAKVYKQTLRTFQVSEDSIKAIEDDLNNMLHMYENKIYYRLNSWYRMTSLYPGYEKNKKYMENMMGVKVSSNETKVQAKTRIVRVYASLIRKLINIKKDSDLFIEKFNRVTKPLYCNTFVGYSNKELLMAYNTLEKEILDDFITPIANDMGAMVFYGMLTDKLKKRKIENQEGLLSGILSKQGNVESVEQTLALLEIVNTIKSSPALTDLFNNEPTENIVPLIGGKGPIYGKIREYIYRFGARTMDELKLETVTMQEDPSFLVDMIKEYLKIDTVQSVSDMKDIDSESLLLSHFNGLDKLHVKKLIQLTKFFIRNRESLRLRRTYVYSIVRNIYLRIGRNFEAEGIINSHRDIFFLTTREISDMIFSGKYEIEQIREKISKRKAEYNENKTKTTYERMCFYGDVTPKNVLPVYSQQEVSDERILQGVAGGGRVVVGKVKFVEDPRDADVEGYILMAKRTDPGWTVLFPLAKAIIIERGSILSHSAVVAREMGITLVAGVRGLTNVIKDGMTVKVDGVNGTVEIIEDNHE